MTDKHPQTMPVQHKIVIGAMLALIIGLGYWWYTTLEWEEKEIDLGYSKEALQNDFLAAEIFLRKHGVQAITVKGQSLLDKHSWRNLKLGQQDTIILINGHKILNQERYDALYEWIENGGTLITSTQNPFIGAHTDENDLLLDDFNIEPGVPEWDADTLDPMKKLADELEKAVEGEKDKNDSDTKADKHQDESDKTNKDAGNKNTDTKKMAENANTKNKKTEKPEYYYRCGLHKDPTLVNFHSEEKPLKFDFSSATPFIYYDYTEHTDNTSEPEEESEYSDEDRDEYSEADSDTEDSEYKERHEHLLYFDVGQGGITITSDNFIWANKRIDCRDHAFALWRLVNPDGRVWFVVNQDAPSLAAIIWRNASYGVIAALLALVFWLWAKSQRFGPVFTLEKAGRRNLAEHIYAGAMLLWRQQQHPQLLTLLRSDILERIEQQHPNLSQPQGDERIEFLHQLTGLAPGAIKHALFADNLQHPQEFATAIAHLQTIRKQL
ncbi:DUF4350 domain-containing protein [Cellvibrio sp. pealriver]|uniref:DUF4350 domain-containing protein n=1 Tax=Cellvibrio sp. pealriver TaxID=1622269 RepID=UPI00066FC5F8|nr:DUF4350 domain-containing protein [Cellvibrio sp. pealriver]